jgi:hypothetical protein
MPDGAALHALTGVLPEKTITVAIQVVQTGTFYCNRQRVDLDSKQMYRFDTPVSF